MFADGQDPGLRRGLLKRRRLLGAAATGAGALAAGLAGCSTQRTTPAATAPANAQSGATAAGGTPQTGGTLKVYLPYNAPLDPQKVSANAQQVPGGAMSRVFRFVTRPDPKVVADHSLENDLGLSAESPDAITWTVKLRPDAKFQNIPPVNGHAVEAEDIKASFLRALDPATGNPNRGSLNMIDPARIETPARDTVVFKLNFQFAPFRRTLASPTYAWIFPREVLTGSYDPLKTVIGSGPFILDSVTPDVAYTAKRNPDWFEKGRPYVDGLRLAVLPDRTAQLAQFSSGNLDEIIFDQVDDLKNAAQQNPKALSLKAENGRPLPIYFQLGDPASVFLDIRVRRAISMAIDRDTIGKALYGGDSVLPLFVPALLGKWALRLEDLDPSMAQYYRYNPAEAKKLLEAAGAVNLQLKFAYVGTGPFSTPTYIKMAETVNSMLNAIGIKTALVSQDYNKDFVDAGKGSRQGYFDKDTILFGASASFAEADEFLFGYFHSKSTSNGEHLRDESLDAMIDKERALTNEDERLKAVRDIEKYIAEKMYTVPTGGTYQYLLVQPGVQNYSYSDSLGKWTETYAKLWLR